MNYKPEIKFYNKNEGSIRYEQSTSTIPKISTPILKPVVIEIPESILQTDITERREIEKPVPRIKKLKTIVIKEEVGNDDDLEENDIIQGKIIY